MFALLTAGCAYDDGEDLRPIVRGVIPAGAEPLGPCGGSDGLIDAPSHACTLLVPGSGTKVTNALAAALARDGFGVACEAVGEVTALRDDVRVTAEVAQFGSISSAGGVVNILKSTYRHPGTRRIPRGSVAVRIGATRLSDSSVDRYRRLIARGGTCDRPFVQESPLVRCTEWWNGAVGEATSEEATRRGAGPEVYVVSRLRVGESSCTYTLRHGRRGFLGMTARFTEGDWHWPSLRRVRPSGAFRPNAVLLANGWLKPRSQQS